MTTQNDPVTDKISARIRKLLALAANNPNVAEAESAAAEAQRLMLEYQISETTIEDKPASVVDGDMDSGEGKSRASMWKVYLASTISKHMSVRVFYTPGTDKIRVVGRGPDVAAASLLYHHLVAQLDRAADVAWARVPAVERRATRGGKVRWVDTFHMGARDAIGKRMSDQKRLVAGAAADPGAALVKIDNYAREAHAAITKFLDDEGLKIRRTTRSARTAGPGAFEAGQRAGNSASLSANARTLPSHR